MTQVQEIFLKILSSALKNERAEDIDPDVLFRQDTAGENTASFYDLRKLAAEQAVTAMVYDYILTWEYEAIPEELRGSLQNQTFSAAMMYYRMVNFVSFLLELVKEQKLHACILKGVSLGHLYPKEELRKTGDVDLYVPVPEEFEILCRLLKSRGFEQETSITDHHISFLYVHGGIRYEIELHKKPINSQENERFNKKVESIYESFTGMGKKSFPEVEIISGSVPVLPAEENVFYLLLHMLQHFLSGGMGIRMLCDWVVFWRHAAKEESFSVEKYLSFVKASGLTGFHYMITGLCVAYLGLSDADVPWMEGHMPEVCDMEAFLKDIFDGGEFGARDSARMLIMPGRLTIKGLFKEYHRQMRLRFQRAGKIPLLWPFLWVATGVIFVYNNMFLRKTSTIEILKSSEERSRLLESLRLFENRT